MAPKNLQNRRQRAAAKDNIVCSMYVRTRCTQILQACGYLTPHLDEKGNMSIILKNTV